MDGLGPHGEVKATFMSKLLTEEEEFKIQERDKTYLKSFKFKTSLPKLIIENSASEKIYDFQIAGMKHFILMQWPKNLIK